MITQFSFQGLNYSFEFEEIITRKLRTTRKENLTLGIWPCAISCANVEPPAINTAIDAVTTLLKELARFRTREKYQKYVFRLYASLAFQM
jgi:hypothetical protein